MRKRAFFAALVCAGPAFASPGGDFAREYINDLSAIEVARKKEEADPGKTTDEKLMGCIRYGTMQQLELNAAIRRMRAMKLPGQMSDTPNMVADAFQARSATFGKLIASCEAMVGGPKPGLDYGKLASTAPKLTAELDFIDKTIFQGSPIVMIALIDEKPDANGKMSKLNITCKDKADLINLINVSFEDINKKNPRYIVGAAKIVRDWLKTSKHTCAPER